MPVSGTTELANVIPEIWSPLFYENLKKQLPMGNFFSRDYEGAIANLGDTVNINEFANPTAEALTDDTDQFASSAVSITKTQLIANRRASVAYEITDLAQLQSLSFESELRTNMTYALAKEIETYIESLISPSASSPDHIVTTASSNDLTAADVGTIADLLSTQGVAFANRSLFCDSSFYHDLLSEASIISKDYIPAGSPAVTAQIPNKVLGFDVFLSNNISTQYKCYGAHRSALQMVMQQGVRIKISDQHANRKYGFVISADVVYGVKQLSDLRSVTMTGS